MPRPPTMPSAPLFIHPTSTSGDRKVKVKVAQLCLTLCVPMDYTVHGILQARILEWVVFPSPGDLSNPGIKHRSHALQADSLPAEPQGKPKDTGVGNLSLLQGIFLTPKLNQCLLHCRWTLYQLSYQGSHMGSFKRPQLDHFILNKV